MRIPVYERLKYPVQMGHDSCDSNWMQTPRKVWPQSQTFQNVSGTDVSSVTCTGVLFWRGISDSGSYNSFGNAAILI